MIASPGIGHNGGPTLNPVLKPFWLKNVRNRVLYGGRASSKSWDAAGFAIFLASNFKVKFMCVRQFQNKIAESVYTLLKIQIERFGLADDFKILESSIVHKRTGSEFIFYGLWRHVQEIKSTEGIDVCWIEEAHNLTKEQWDILEPTLRSDASQFWIIFNPRLTTDFVWKRFVASPPPNTEVRQINYTENPFLSQTMLDVIAAKKAEDEDEYNHIYLGQPRDDDDQVIIKRSWILAAIDAHKVLGISPQGLKRIGFDVADSGADKNALVEAYGWVATGLEEWKGAEDELPKSASRVYDRAIKNGCEVDYDSIGVGAFAGGHFQGLNNANSTTLTYHKFNAGGGVVDPDAKVDPDNLLESRTNKDYYANIKAQAWWEVAARFRNTYNAVHRGMQFSPDDLISISSDIPKLESLIDELSTPRRDFDNAGRVKVESKKDLAKPTRVGGPQPSPNKADAFIMAFARRERGAVAAMILKSSRRAA